MYLLSGFLLPSQELVSSDSAICESIPWVWIQIFALSNIIFLLEQGDFHYVFNLFSIHWVAIVFQNCLMSNLPQVSSNDDPPATHRTDNGNFLW